jgi:hypothetical protein
MSVTEVEAMRSGSGNGSEVVVGKDEFVFVMDRVLSMDIRIHTRYRSECLE